MNDLKNQLIQNFCSVDFFNGIKFLARVAILISIVFVVLNLLCNFV